MKIMLVDDDRTMQAILKTLLELDHHQVIIWDGISESDTLSQIQREMPELLILDYYLRDKNGTEIVKEIRQNPVTRNIRVIMTSGQYLKEECLEAGADAFLLKPYMPDDLLSLIHQVQPHE
ncbi:MULTISPECIES: PleD family two-component system response regulator [Anaerolinea]|jgi:CheY-like chemotaxis protein|uniref:response regulator n=1 Tax=Anaerolinea TaxID=233189 RepID=UPI00260D902F|nr:response regulator [Anaerolinea thermophila]